MAHRKPAEVFHPGVFIKEEMESRGWSVETLAEKSMMQRPFIEELTACHCRITPLSAHCLSMAFGTSKQFWIDLQKSYDENRQAKSRVKA